MYNMDFLDKVVLITGASSGIGAATADYLASCGAKLSLTGRKEEQLKEVANRCSKQENTLLLIAELTKEEDVLMLINRTIEHYGRLDVLVNCAGIIESGGIESTSLEQYDRIFNINVRSMYHITMLAVPHLVKSKGNIVNVSSVTGLRASPGLLSYCMSKSAVDQFTKCVALDLAPYGIRVNSVNPGVIVTELHKRGGMSDQEYEAFLEKSKTIHPLGRPGKADEVAKTIAFLASDNASFITGAILSVDGGRQLMCPR